MLQPEEPSAVAYLHPQLGEIDLHMAAMMARGELPGENMGLVKVSAHLRPLPLQRKS
jgi:hypothetical protein